MVITNAVLSALYGTPPCHEKLLDQSTARAACDAASQKTGVVWLLTATVTGPTPYECFTYAPDAAIYEAVNDDGGGGGQPTGRQTDRTTDGQSRWTPRHP